MEAIVVLSVMGIAAVLLFLGICLNAREREQDAETLDKGDAYHARSDPTRGPEGSPPTK